MVNKIIDGMVTAIYDVFGEEYEIITEDLKQGLKTPCFSVRCLNSAMIKKVMGRYQNRNLFCVYYFPQSDYDPKRECLDVMTKLISALEEIRVDGNVVRGINLSAEIRDNVLSCFVNYNMSLMKGQETRPSIDQIQSNIGVNHG